MLKKTIEYTDYNGNNRTEDFYFNLTKAEVAEWELSEKGGMGEKIQGIINANDETQIMAIFKEIVLKSYGVKSDDGRRFIKSPELAEEFSQTEAYSILFMELVTSQEAMTAFVNAVTPTFDDVTE